jgi:hypothetical protein
MRAPDDAGATSLSRDLKASLPACHQAWPDRTTHVVPRIDLGISARDLLSRGLVGLVDFLIPLFLGR